MLRHAAGHPDHDARVALPAADLAARGRSSRSVETVIVDEIHSVVATKRGAHLFLSLERLEELARGRPLQRIGLSATQRPLEEVARLLGGGEGAAARGSRGRSRSWTPARKAFDLRSRCRSRTWRASARSLELRETVPTRRRPPAAPLDLAVDPSAAGRARARAPLDDDLRQQPAAGGAAGRRAERDRGRGDRARAPRLDRPREAAARSRTR